MIHDGIIVYFFLRVHLTGSKYQYLWVNHEGEGCKTENKLLTYTNHYKNIKKEVVADLADWETLLFDVNKITLTLHRERMAKAYINSTIYGYTDWAAKKPKNISGKKFNVDSEDTELSEGEARSSTMKIVGDRLYYAKYVNGKAVERLEYFLSASKIGRYILGADLTIVGESFFEMRNHAGGP